MAIFRGSLLILLLGILAWSYTPGAAADGSCDTYCVNFCANPWKNTPCMSGLCYGPGDVPHYITCYGDRYYDPDPDPGEGPGKEPAP